jgi:type IV pilus assembly protein PilE
MMINLSQRHPSSKGFTLMETMIVLLIVAILAMIAYPSYVNQIRKSKRAVAKNALLDAANREEQYFFSNKTYADALNLLSGYSSATVLFDKNGVYTTSAIDAVYALSVVAVDDATACGTAPCFQLQAVPQNDQSNDACGTYTITSTNNIPRGSSTTASNC